MFIQNIPLFMLVGIFGKQSKTFGDYFQKFEIFPIRSDFMSNRGPMLNPLEFECKTRSTPPWPKSSGWWNMVKYVIPAQVQSGYITPTKLDLNWMGVEASLQWVVDSWWQTLFVGVFSSRKNQIKVLWQNIMKRIWFLHATDFQSWNFGC